MKDKIERIRFLLKEANKSLNEITNNNFEKNLLYVKNVLKESQKHKLFLIEKYSKDELMIFESDLTNLAKEIKKTFDSIIENKKLELDKIKEQIRRTQNQKKLVNYIR
jgi:hypothetical protein